MRRKDVLESGEIYHIFNRSIAGYVIFNNDREYDRMVKAIDYFQNPAGSPRFTYLENPEKSRPNAPPDSTRNDIAVEPKLVDIFAYCLMPTHFHLILRQKIDGGISTFVGNLQNSYSRYFNIKHNRRGPLWEGRFKNVLVKSDDQLIHLTRYIHLNPSTANLVQNPEDWAYSSYKEYILMGTPATKSICKFQDLLKISPKEYQDFVANRVSYQKELASIKHLLLE